MKEITIRKRSARDAGLHGILFTDFADSSGLRYTMLDSGLIAEVVEAWMLGRFMSVKNTGLKVDISDYLDHKRKADFRLERYGRSSLIQVKFNNNKEVILPADVKLLRFGPDPDAFKGKFFIPPMRGNDVLFQILNESGLYSEEELYDLFEERPDFEGLISGSWKYIKN